VHASKFAAAVGVCALLLAASPPRASAAEATVVIESGGLSRQYLVHRPPAPVSGSGKVPAVLIFHRGDGTAAEMVGLAGFDRVANRHGFVTVYPQGFADGWNDGRGVTKAGALGVDDIGFVSAIIDRLVADDNVDPARVYATGLSNGAMLVENLGCRLSGKIAAIAPVAGPMPAADAPGCAPGRPMPVLEIHGTADPFLPYRGSPGVDSVPQTQQIWRDADGCGPVTATGLPRVVDDGTSVTRRAAVCRGGADVELYLVSGGGHTWPDGAQYLPRSQVGAVSHQFDAAETIWQFFATQPR
jgi:polyhydroxybutyrate depolymerase